MTFFFLGYCYSRLALKLNSVFPLVTLKPRCLLCSQSHSLLLNHIRLIPDTNLHRHIHDFFSSSSSLQKPQHRSLWMRPPRSWWWRPLWTARRVSATDSWWSAQSEQTPSSPRWKPPWTCSSWTRTIMHRMWTGRTRRTSLSASIGQRWEQGCI